MYKIIGADQREYGPVTADQIRQWIAEGRANRQTKVRPENGTEWLPLSEIPEFASAFDVGGPAPTSAAALFTQPPGDRSAALSEVKGPAISLLIIAIFGLLLAAYYLVMGLIGFANPHAMDLPDVGNPEFQKLLNKAVESSYGVLGIVHAIVGGIVGLTILLGALKMQKLENYSWAFAASILVMIPCLNPCCCLTVVGIPLGIWSLVVLNKPAVKSQFH
jgi:hypothetical protein